MPGNDTTGGALARRLTLNDAVVLGLGSMIGAGVFAAIGPAAQAAGAGLLVGLALAAMVAYANATSSAQLAALYPQSGGTYVYGRERLGPFWGTLAGFGFVIGKTSSLAAMALTFGAYAAPEYARPMAVAAVVALTAVNVAGVRKTAGLTKVIVVSVLAALAAVVAAALGGGSVEVGNLDGVLQASPTGVLQAAGLLFFAFAGYARIATLGEEVIDPAVTIPKAIPRALGLTLVVYVIVAVTALLAVGPEELAASSAPLATAVEAGRFAAGAPLVRVGATIAAAGVLLSLIAGVSRTGFAMARDGYLPAVLTSVHPTRKVPHVAELTVGAIVIVLVLLVDLRGAIGFSSFAVLTYYAIANASAVTLEGEERRWPRWIAIGGVVGCVVLAFSLPVVAVVGGAALLGVGAVIHVVVTRRRR
ncbi:MAG: amino acid permease [Nitriliruptoraceae bacterium]|nr:amino acid permease [Nitriliruptoraceae bacterium]